jgi:lysophospholipase L1-like esterase
MKKILLLIALCYSVFITACSTSRNATAIASGAKYVALGSSFAAGPGIDTQLGSCGRSDHSYSQLVAEDLSLSITNVSCNGATIANILDTPQGESPLQINAVTPDTALVTVTIGGNDINYTSSTFACSGTAADELCTANLDQASINAAIERLPARLGEMFDTIKARAPEATIVLVAYPRVFPDDATSCSELELSAEDTNYLAAMGTKLEAAFVSATSSKQILIADSYVLAEGHGPCASTERWVNGATVVESGIRYHPTARGHIEMARLVLAALEGN